MNRQLIRKKRVCFPYVYRRAAVQTTGCLGDRFELMSLLVEIQEGTDTRQYRGNQSSRQSPGHSQCLLGFHSDQLKDGKDKGVRTTTEKQQQMLHSHVLC